MKFLLGITGMIGSGKSTAAKIFEEFGAFRVSSDDLAKVYTSEKSPIKDKIALSLGKEVIGPDGNLDRKKIAQIVFFDTKKLQILNGLIHPLVLKDFLTLADSIQEGRIIAWEIPLLFETGSEKICDATLTVFTDEETAYARVKNRNNISKTEFLARLSNQMSIKDKLRLSDFSIENDGKTEDLRDACGAIYNKIMKEKKE